MAMETIDPTLHPLAVIFSSPRVRRHLLAAGQELLQAWNAGIAEVTKEAGAAGMMRQYPYLQSALGSLQQAVSAWVGTQATEAAPPAHPTKTARRKKTTTTKRSPRRRTDAKRG